MSRSTTPDAYVRPQLMTTDAAAEYLDLKPGTLEVWRTRGEPQVPYVKIGRLVRYRRQDLDNWMDARTVHAEPLEAAGV